MTTIQLGGSFTAGVKDGYERTTIVDIWNWIKGKIGEAVTGVDSEGNKLGGSFARAFSSGADDPSIDLTATVGRWIDGAKSVVTGAISSAQAPDRAS